MTLLNEGVTLLPTYTQYFFLHLEGLYFSLYPSSLFLPHRWMGLEANSFKGSDLHSVNKSREEELK